MSTKLSFTKQAYEDVRRMSPKDLIDKLNSLVNDRSDRDILHAWLSYRLLHQGIDFGKRVEEKLVGVMSQLTEATTNAAEREQELSEQLLDVQKSMRNWSMLPVFVTLAHIAIIAFMYHFGPGR